MMKGKLLSTMIRSGIWYSMENLAVDNLTILAPANNDESQASLNYDQWYLIQYGELGSW